MRLAASEVTCGVAGELPPPRRSADARDRWQLCRRSCSVPRRWCWWASALGGSRRSPEGPEPNLPTQRRVQHMTRDDQLDQRRVSPAGDRGLGAPRRQPPRRPDPRPIRLAAAARGPPVPEHAVRDPGPGRDRAPAFPFATNMWADHKQGELASEFGDGGAAHRLRPAHDQARPGTDPADHPQARRGHHRRRGTTPSALRAGSGHSRTTALPCETGNAAIAGHRTTYSKPFANIDKLGRATRSSLRPRSGSAGTRWRRCHGRSRTVWLDHREEVGRAHLTHLHVPPSGELRAAPARSIDARQDPVQPEDGTFVDAVQS